MREPSVHLVAVKLHTPTHTRAARFMTVFSFFFLFLWQVFRVAKGSRNPRISACHTCRRIAESEAVGRRCVVS